MGSSARYDMGNAADTLVSKNPTRIAQLKGPVLAYLRAISRSLPFNGTDQDIYLSVFYPAYRRKSASAQFPANVRNSNPGINTPADYISRVNKQKLNVLLSPQEWTALKDTANTLNIAWEPLYKMINFESAWNPKARNPVSGARGLIQFIPSTAKGMGYNASIGMGTILLLLGAGYFTVKKLRLL